MIMRKGPMIATCLVAAAAFAGGAAGQDWKQVTMSRQLDGDRPVDVEVQYTVGRLNVRPLEGGSLLYRMNLEYDQDLFRPIDEYAPGELRIGAESVRRRMKIRGDMEGGELDLELSPLVPMDLSMSFGAVKAEIDLGGLRLTRLHFETGASETDLRVSEPNPERARLASFEVGQRRSLRVNWVT